MGRVQEVNRELRRRDYVERLRRGRGYYYFSGGSTGGWPETAVYVNSADALTRDEWMDEHWRLREQAFGGGER